MKRNNEEIIVISDNGLEAARAEAARFSNTRNHGWCNVNYIENGDLIRETYSSGRHFKTLTATKFPGDGWFSCGKTKGLTILNAMVRYGDESIKKQAIALGSSGTYSKL